MDNYDFGKFQWKNLLEGDYKIKYFIYPKLNNDSLNSKIDSKCYMKFSKDHDNTEIYDEICNCLSGNNKTFEIPLSSIYENISHFPDYFLNSNK
jgi:hypothetical protein